MKRFLMLMIATLSLLSSAVASTESHPAGSAAHLRPVLFHDRSPRPHLHNVLPHH